MKILAPLILASLACGAAPAQAHGRGFHPYGHHARSFIGLSLGIGGPAYWGGAYYPVVPGGYVMAPPAPVVVAPVPVEPPPPASPIAYPRNGQGPQQTEADWRECNRWATTQPGAMAEAQVFERAVAACMDGHGYSVR